ncbi:Vma22p [Saccharomyces cerevisiae x Saccharomyces kudriavzevii VIN7]|uniref:Vacuolar ATPase assembly protein VMA22 n=1 Tax=Saccharomyces cerevisiae x Saccharomyces kudriavzevii (strain VIN7) TaxID=1095631 RepID=H0GVR3_SACCK|nr:Vma22p [Saccharomyces cerevisiae x Saccharomyces kudriavzevii VIN7]
MSKSTMAASTNATDGQYLRLIELLADYDSTLEQLQKGFQDGHIHLSRSNYYNKDSLRGNYGKDYWDKTYAGQLMATVDDSNSKSVIDIVKRKVQENEETKKEEDSTLVQRKKGAKSEEQKPKDPKLKQDYDPILMFGGVLSVPSSLRQSQTSFRGCIPLMVQLVNYRNEILTLVKTLSEQKE